jgi:hypothetical protein
MSSDLSNSHPPTYSGTHSPLVHPMQTTNDQIAKLARAGHDSRQLEESSCLLLYMRPSGASNLRTRLGGLYPFRGFSVSSLRYQ